MIDLHCHILPYTDDGAGDLQESLAMARHAVADGIHTLVATPHTFNGVYTYSRKQIEQKVNWLARQLADERVELKLLPGAEVHLSTDLMEFLDKETLPFLDPASSFVLLEFPFQVLPAGYKDAIFQLRIRNITPIIAHPERHPVFQKDLAKLAALIQMGCLTQLTAASITGKLGPAAMKCGHKILARHMAHIIASDAHSASHRPPELSKAVEVAGKICKNPDQALAMVTTIPQAVIHGNPPPIPEMEFSPKKRWFHRFIGNFSH